MAETYQTVLPREFKIDIFRLCILYHQGGAYLTAEPGIPLHTWLPINRIVAFQSQNSAAGLDLGMLYSPRPFHPVFKLALQLIRDRVQHREYGVHPTDVTGGRIILRALNSYLGCELTIDCQHRRDLALGWQNAEGNLQFSNFTVLRLLPTATTPKYLLAWQQRAIYPPTSVVPSSPMLNSDGPPDSDVPTLLDNIFAPVAIDVTSIDLPPMTTGTSDFTLEPDQPLGFQSNVPDVDNFTLQSNISECTSHAPSKPPIKSSKSSRRLKV
jgi:hypothetical protein